MNPLHHTHNDNSLIWTFSIAKLAKAFLVLAIFCPVIPFLLYVYLSTAPPRYGASPSSSYVRTDRGRLLMYINDPQLGGLRHRYRNQLFIDERETVDYIYKDELSEEQEDAPMSQSIHIDQVDTITDSIYYPHESTEEDNDASISEDIVNDPVVESSGKNDDTTKPQLKDTDDADVGVTEEEPIPRLSITDNDNDNEPIIPMNEYYQDVERMKDHAPPSLSIPNEPINPSNTKPIRSNNLEIISRSHPIDLSYVHLFDNNSQKFPQIALDELGQFGYVHNETSLHANINNSSFQLNKKETNRTCKHDGNYKMLTEKVHVNITAHLSADKKSKIGGPKRIQLFCAIYTIQQNHHKLPALIDTWLPKCDGYMIASNETDQKLGTVRVAHDGPDAYNNIWQKVRSIWSYIYGHYYETYDYFHIGGDDLYLIVENLRLYLESMEIRLASNGGHVFPKGNETKQYPLFLGRRFAEQGNMNRIFNSGGSGYTLNKSALKALVVYAFPTCMPHRQTFAEDVMVAQCLRQKVQVYPYDTKDDYGGERYMPFQPAHHLMYHIPEDTDKDWYAKYSIGIKEGLDHCSTQSVAFHYIDSELMRQMHAILYGHCG